MRTFFIGIFLIAVLMSHSMALPAFPGAQGYGSDTPGGRGGKVIQVTTLEDGGTGSLRAAVEASGPRIVVFRVSGTIALKSDLTIKNPQITIAGQSAPGDGICLKNYKLMISAKDVVVRYLRIRRGNVSGKADDAMAIAEAENVIVDHCSISWGCDEVVNTWHGAKNITIQWCIISEGLHHKDHGFAATLGGVNASYHHNLIANCPGRNPSIGGNHVYQTHNMDFRNSIIFNFGYRTFDGKPSSVNIVNNYFKPGPMSTQTLFASIDAPSYEAVGIGKWYISGNVWDGNETISKDNTAGTTGAKNLLVSTPMECAPVTTVSAQDAYALVLADVGARLPKQDPVDVRIIEETKTGKTTYGNGTILNEKDAGGWPELKSTEPLADTDKDGMPDAWENEKGLNPNSAVDGSADRNSDGYTNVEEYLNELSGDIVSNQRINVLYNDAQIRNRLNITMSVYGGATIEIDSYKGDGAFEIFRQNGEALYQGLINNGHGRFDAGMWAEGAYIIRARINEGKGIYIVKRLNVCQSYSR